MPWKEGDLLPYDGYYNGNVKLMMLNGTYIDYRPKLLQMADEGFFGKIGEQPERIKAGHDLLAKYDKEWDAIPLDERIKRRNRVADDVQIREVIVNTARGPMKTRRATPSLNNNAYNPSGKNRPKKNPFTAPPGWITRENSPLEKFSSPQAPHIPAPVDMHGPVEAHLSRSK